MTTGGTRFSLRQQLGLSELVRAWMFRVFCLVLCCLFLPLCEECGIEVAAWVGLCRMDLCRAAMAEKENE